MITLYVAVYRDLNTGETFAGQAWPDRRGVGYEWDMLTVGGFAPDHLYGRTIKPTMIVHVTPKP